MEVRNRVTGDVISVTEFKAAHPNTSFPKRVTASMLDSFGYDPILPGAQAETTPPYQVSVRDGVKEVDGQWFENFVAGPLFTDTVDENGNVVKPMEDNEAEYRQRVDERVAGNVRNDRFGKLKESDWTQMADSPLTAEKKAEWATYRQALRDISSAEGFPHNVTWPTEPS